MNTSDDRQNGQTFLTVAQVAELLNVTTRTVRRYIEQGIAGPGGSKIKLSARLVATDNGQEYQIGQTDLKDFTKQRAQSVRERVTDQQLPAVHTPSNEERDRLHTHLLRALSTIEQQAAQISSLGEAIERLATEKGRLEAENMLLRQQFTTMQTEQKQSLFLRAWRGLLSLRPSSPAEIQTTNEHSKPLL